MSLKLGVRNEALYNDWKSGTMKMWELVSKYHISANRIYFIVNRMRLEDAAPNLDQP